MKGGKSGQAEDFGKASSPARHVPTNVRAPTAHLSEDNTERMIHKATFLPPLVLFRKIHLKSGEMLRQEGREPKRRKQLRFEPSQDLGGFYFCPLISPDSVLKAAIKTDRISVIPPPKTGEYRQTSRSTTPNSHHPTPTPQHHPAAALKGNILLLSGREGGGNITAFTPRKVLATPE
ncbi:hypothetical protein JZ751_011383 [Albula glossodonta]|uniref:Uncharacterized protein n=1 Tax=Albula glossodonta TaxID=121402 RepID=A0A8T2NAK5_9TELE|nr:hypothetical protein JZ751_011383 [Albula glossodonta]